MTSSLSNSFWICGGILGGKTTISSMLQEKYGLFVYHADEYQIEHGQRADEAAHPELFELGKNIKQGKSYAEILYSFSLRPKEEIHAKSLRFHQEHFSMTLLDVRKICESGKKVLVDGVFLPSDMEGKIGKSNAVFLITTDERLSDLHARRQAAPEKITAQIQKDIKDFKENRAEDALQAEKNMSAHAAWLTKLVHSEAQEKGYSIITNDRNSTIESLLKAVEGFAQIWIAAESHDTKS